jgi:hypothetical protein
MTAILYASMILLAEITLGNQEFPISLWHFTLLQQWCWSLPVHLAGFIWLNICVLLMKKRSIAWPIIFSTSYFVSAETVNLLVFHFFEYGNAHVESIVAFILVNLLYLCLCALCCICIRSSINEQ